MKKAERQLLVKKLLDEGVEHNEIIIEVVTDSQASEATVKSDIKALTNDDEGETGSITVKVNITDSEKNNSEHLAGRKTEYEVKESEQGHIHIEVEATSFSTAGKKTSVPRVVKLDRKAWNKFRQEVIGLGYNHRRILYAPSDMTEEQLAILKPRTLAKNKA